MPRRGVSPRQRALIQRIRVEHGLAVSETQLERWRGWRGVGLIPGPPPGTRTRWRPGLAESLPAEEVERVAEVAQLVVVRHLGLDVAALVLAMRERLPLTQLDGPTEGLAAALRMAAEYAALREAFLRFHKPWFDAVEADPGEAARRGVDHARRLPARRGGPSARRVMADIFEKSGIGREHASYDGGQTPSLRVAFEHLNEVYAGQTEASLPAPTIRDARSALAAASGEEVCAALQLGVLQARQPDAVVFRETFGRADEELHALYFALDILTTTYARAAPMVPTEEASR